VTVDPNIRPWVISDADAYRRRLRRIMAQSHVLKVSEEDAAWLDPHNPPLAAARAMLDAGPVVVLLTRGPDGVVVVTRDGESAVQVAAAKVVDTIGAGDAFGGGFLAWWRSQGLGSDALADLDTVAEAARFGCLVAARTVERAGASPPHLSELDLGEPPA
jgi:fructokinase